MDKLVETVVLQLPNFAGLLLSLILILRQNDKLTNQIVRLSERCDCSSTEEDRPTN